MTEFNINIDEFITGILNHPDLKPHGREKTYKKGEHLFIQGDSCSDIFCLRSGLVKLYYSTREGKEWIKSFIADQGIAGSRSAQLLGKASPFSVVCLEESVAVSFPYAQFENVCMKDTELSRAVFHFSQWLGLKKEIREYRLLCLSAREAYAAFISSSPELAKRLTQIDIARYLGITPIALSRIKKNIA